MPVGNTDQASYVTSRRQASPGRRTSMYALSRSTYKEVAPFIEKEPVNPRQGTNRELVLHACETTMQRLGDDYRHFPHPERYLFEQIRPYFQITEQLRVYNIIRKNIALASEVVKAYASKGYKPDGTRLRCRA